MNEDSLARVIYVALVILVVLLVLFLTGARVEAFCDSHMHYQNYTVYSDWHLGNFYFNYECSYTEGNQTIIIN